MPLGDRARNAYNDGTLRRFGRAQGAGLRQAWTLAPTTLLRVRETGGHTVDQVTTERPRESPALQLTAPINSSTAGHSRLLCFIGSYDIEICRCLPVT
jgi:hypothetical protein